MGPGSAADSSVLGGLGKFAPSLEEDGSNWVLYHDRMKDLLLSQSGFRKHLTGRAKPPAEPKITKGEEDTKDNLALVEKYEDDMDAYMRKESHIRLLICGTVPNRIQQRLISTRTAKAMWDLSLKSTTSGARRVTTL